MSDVACCVHSVSKKMSDVQVCLMLVGGGSRGPMLGGAFWVLREGGGGWEKLCLNQICPPPLLKKQNPRGKREVLTPLKNH